MDLENETTSAGKQMPTMHNRGPELAAVAGLFLGLSWITMISRIWVRLKVTKSLGADDWIMSAALVNFILQLDIRGTDDSRPYLLSLPVLFTTVFKLVPVVTSGNSKLRMLKRHLKYLTLDISHAPSTI
jgi:hypothetical protein